MSVDTSTKGISLRDAKRIFNSLKGFFNDGLDRTNKDIKDNHYTKDEVDKKIATAASGGTIDLDSYAKKADIPINVSQLTNDVPFADKSTTDNMQMLISSNSRQINDLSTSSVSKDLIADNLATADEGYVLGASQGKALMDIINNIRSKDITSIKSLDNSSVVSWASKPSGTYADLGYTAEVYISIPEVTADMIADVVAVPSASANVLAPFITTSAGKITLYATGLPDSTIYIDHITIRKVVSE